VVEKKFIDYLKNKYSKNYLYFDEFMQECLYSDYGFFAKGEVRSSKSGDFLTSPEVSNYFGLFISNWIKENRINSDSNILEVGAGTGSLANQVSKYLEKEIYVSEISLNALKALKSKNFLVDSNLDNYGSSQIKTIYMNEVLDNIPCSVGIEVDNTWYEKTIEFTKDNELRYGKVEIRESNLKWIKRYNFLDNQDNELEIQYNTEQFLDELIKKVDPNHLLIFDYGFEYEERNLKPYKSLIRTYKEHHLSSDPIEMPTETDITYDVNFSFLKQYFEENNFEYKIMKQYEFLDKYGYQEIYSSLKNQFVETYGVDQLKLKSDIVGLEAIHNDRGLGGFYCIEAKKL